MRDFRNLSVWQKSHQLTLAVYQLTAGFPRDEAFGLTSQIRRASSSVGANIAEGCGRDTAPDFVRFLHMAAGSASELEYHLLLARDLGHVSSEDYESAAAGAVEVKKMLTGLIQRMNSGADR